MVKKSSLEEFEELERNITEPHSAYEVVPKRNGESKAKKKDNDMSKTMNKGNVNETGAERQRLAKEKQEFRKQKEKFEAEKLALEKAKRDLDKQKLEFEKHKDVEMKKINAEKQKIDKERKQINRQNDTKKTKDDIQQEKLYKEIDLLKEELKKKDHKVFSIHYTLE